MTNQLAYINMLSYGLGMNNAAQTNPSKFTSNTQAVVLHPDLPLTVTEAGEGRPVLILHGGGGPMTVAAIAAHLAESMHTIVPTHPGWNGTPRPEWFNGIDDLALAYLQLLSDRGLRDVLVIGSSLGGWVAAEMALRDQSGIIAGLVLVGATGVQVEGESIRSVFGLDLRSIAEYSFHDASRFFFDPATLPPEQVARQRANMATMKVVAGENFDPKLLRRLARVQTPTLALWGESDRFVTPTYGKAYAAAFPKGHFEVIEKAGHLPHFEQPAAVFARIDAFRAGLT